MKELVTVRDVLPFLSRLTEEAGQVLLSYFSGSFRIERKGGDETPIDIVTDADRVSEDLILKAIAREFPDHDVLAEETPPALTGSRWLWIVDPLDGTVNFAHGLPLFCISIGLMHDNVLVAGMVYDPLRRESFFALRGEGAFLDGNRIEVSQADRLDRSLVATGFPYDRGTAPDNNVKEFASVVTRVQGIRRAGSAALDLAYVAAGRLDGFWELKLKPWDMAAGMILVEEAGGRVSDRTGSPTDVYTYCVVATNGKIHDPLLKLLI
ncbi:MAG: inositol monophosphatase [Desulfomonile tiedjei]|nr:inositol monophosphatase [Desulfomonile tiedjei]